MNEQDKITELRKQVADLQDYERNYLSRYNMKRRKKFYQQKTFWVAVLYAATIFAPQFIAINPSQLTVIQGLLVAVGAIFMRDGIEGLK